MTNHVEFSCYRMLTTIHVYTVELLPPDTSETRTPSLVRSQDTFCGTTYIDLCTKVHNTSHGTLAL